MAYDSGLAERLTDYFSDRSDVEVKKMFGGLCYMVAGHMCCGIVNDRLMARVGPEHYQACLRRPHAMEMDFTGKAMKGMVYVLPQGYESDADLTRWVSVCESFVSTLPPKSESA